MSLIWLVMLVVINSLNFASAQWTEPVLVDSPSDTIGVNTGAHDWCPFLSSDGQLLYFASERGDPSATDIFVSRWTGTQWGDRMRLPVCQPNVDERNPTVSPSNDTLYYVGWAPGWDIFWCFRTGPCDTCWGQPQRMPEPINSNAIEFSVWPTPDNQRLLFSTWRDGMNGEDIYECRRDTATETGWSDPTPLLGALRTWDIESYPSMGLDTTELFFWGRNAQLCVSHLSDSGWTFGDPLPASINRQSGETTPSITPDGHRLYFGSAWGHPSGNADVWCSDRELSSTPRSDSNGRQPSGIQVIPNPVRDNATFQMAGGIRKVTIYDLLGRMIASQSYGDSPSSIQWRFGLWGKTYPSGIYILVGQSRSKISVTRFQFIK